MLCLDAMQITNHDRHLYNKISWTQIPFSSQNTLWALHPGNVYNQIHDKANQIIDNRKTRAD